MSEKTPADRKQAGESFTFTVKGKTYHLPAIGESAAERIPGDVTFNAVMEPENEMAQMRLALATLVAAKPDPAAMAALKSLPTKEMIETVGRWLGESSGSSA